MKAADGKDEVKQERNPTQEKEIKLKDRKEQRNGGRRKLKQGKRKGITA